MDSKEHRLCSSSIVLPCVAFLEAQIWLKQAQQNGCDYLVAGHLSLLSKEHYVDLSQNNIFDLATMWGHIGEEKKESFHKRYGDIAALLSIVIEKPMLRATIELLSPE